jgi:glycosyltransferase involved in cell wall biosynthesis
MRKVLHILSELKPSGAETMLECAADIFTKEGIKTSILSTGKNIGVYATALQSKGYAVQHIPFTKSISFFIKFIKNLKINNYDAVHIHVEQAFIYYAFIIWLYGVKKVIRTVHHIYPWNGYLKYRSMIHRKICVNILGVIFTSNSLSGKNNEKKYYDIDNVLIPNWFDSNKYKSRSKSDYIISRKNLDIHDDQMIIVSLGGNSGYKNYNLIVEALSLLQKEVKVLYLQVGSLMDEEADIKELARSLKVEDKVRFCGRVQDPLPYLNCADVYIMPSSIEGFGVAAAEAMAVGLPSILSNRPALSDFKHDCEEIVYTDCDPVSIATAIGTMWNWGLERRWISGQKLAQVMQKKYGLDVGPLEFIKLYKS